MKTIALKMETERETWIDVCRGIGILFVLLGHTQVPFKKIIYGFHMPLFFMLSGFLYHDKGLTYSWLKRELQRYIVPYFILSFINLMIQMILQSLNLVQHSSLARYIFGILYSRGSTKWMPNCSPLWFLTCLFNSLLLYQILQKVKKDIYYYSLLFVLAMIGFILDVLNAPKLPWNLDTAFVSLIFIEAGNQLERHGFLFELIKHPIIVFFSGGIGFFCIWLNPVEIVDFDSNSYGLFSLMLIGSLSISIAVMTVCRFVLDEKNSIINRSLAFIGRHTLFIMGFDYFSASLARKALNDIGAQIWITEFLLKLITQLSHQHNWYKSLNFQAK